MNVTQEERSSSINVILMPLVIMELEVTNAYVILVIQEMDLIALVSGYLLILIFTAHARVNSNSFFTRIPISKLLL